jgi:hypothetical protein
MIALPFNLWKPAALGLGGLALVTGLLAGWQTLVTIPDLRKRNREAASALDAAGDALKTAAIEIRERGRQIAESEDRRSAEYRTAIDSVVAARTRCDRTAAWRDGYAAGLIEGGRDAENAADTDSGDCVHELRDALGQRAATAGSGTSPP